MLKPVFWFPPSQARRTAFVASVLAGVSFSAIAQVPVVPGYVPPVRQTEVAEYVDDTRGVFVPPHEILRSKTESELANWNAEMADSGRPLYAQKNPNGESYEGALNMMANGVADTRSELERIGEDPGLLAGGGASNSYEDLNGVQMAQNTAGSTSRPAKSMEEYPSLATGGKPAPTARSMDMGNAEPTLPMPQTASDGGIELAVGSATASGPVDFAHGMVHLKEERISVRRAIQRMLDQIGGSTWAVVWDLDEVNAGLPDMEISVYAEEPFIKVLNALLARLQTRSGQPLRVIKYDKTMRLVITDRIGGDAKSGAVGSGASTKGYDGADLAVTETVLKDSTVSLHYDEVPLVDALENIVNQAGRGQWRLRMYAGTDQVLKPAHVEEPFGIAIERILKVFNLRYEIFPGGKLIVVTGSDKFGFKGIE